MDNEVLKENSYGKYTLEDLLSRLELSQKRDREAGFDTSYQYTRDTLTVVVWNAKGVDIPRDAMLYAHVVIIDGELVKDVLWLHGITDLSD